MRIRASCVRQRLPVALAGFLTGIMAGFFFAYSFNVNYALLELTGGEYAVVQSLLNKNVRHPVFGFFFFGTAISGVLAVVSNRGHRRKHTFWILVSAAVVYIIGIIVVTSQINFPINEYTESWDPASLPLDWDEMRDRWNVANGVRLAAAGASFGLYLLALIRPEGDTR